METKVDWGEADPFKARGEQMKDMYTFKGGKRPPDNLGFKSNKPKVEIEPFKQFDEAREGY